MDMLNINKPIIATSLNGEIPKAQNVFGAQVEGVCLQLSFTMAIRCLWSLVTSQSFPIPGTLNGPQHAHY